MNQSFETLWHKLSEEVMTGMREWRVQHPTATLSEIEDALDERLSGMRARMLEDLVSERGKESKPMTDRVFELLGARWNQVVDESEE